MGQQPNLEKSSLVLQPGSMMVFGPLVKNQTQTARFTDHQGHTVTAGTADRQRSAWDFEFPMSTMTCHSVAIFIGETFGLKVVTSEKRKHNLEFIFADGIGNYTKPKQLILDRHRHHLVIVLDHKDIIADLNGGAADNLASMAEIIAALHGFTCRRTEPGRTTWRRPDNQQQIP